MSIAFDIFCFIMPFAKPNAVVLSTWMIVGGWWCPMLISILQMGMASLAFTYVAPIYASAANLRACFWIFARAYMGPLWGHVTGLTVLFDRYKYPPAWLRDLRVDRYEPLLCMWSKIQFLWKHIVASGLVAIKLSEWVTVRIFISLIFACSQPRFLRMTRMVLSMASA